MLCDLDGAMLAMRAALFSPDGSERVDGAATFPVVDESAPARLAAELKLLCQGRGKLLAMAERARLVARPRAAEELAAACVEQLEAA